MTRAPFAMAKADSAFSRSAKIEDTTIGWRFVNAAMVKAYGVDSMPETGENVASDYQVSRADQDAFKVSAARSSGRILTNAPLYRPIGVRIPSHMYATDIAVIPV